MPGWDGLRARVRAHPRIADALLAVVVFGFSRLMPGSDHRVGGGIGRIDGIDSRIDGATIALTALGSAMLLLRRSLPVPVWLGTVLVGVVGVLVAGGPPSSIVPSFVALYGLASRRSLPVTAVVGLATAAAPLLASVVADRWFGDLAYGVIGWSGMAAAIGAVARSPTTSR